MLKPIFDINKIGVDYFMCSVPIPPADAHKYDTSVVFTENQLAAYQQDMTHPSVQYIPNGWNGHKWWMVNTPFPGEVGVWENPCIFYADDQENGEPPVLWHGIESNPIVKVRTNTEVNSDPILYIDEDSGKGYCFSRENTFSNHPYYYGQESTDGETWTERPYHDLSKCIENPGLGKWIGTPANGMASGTILKVDGKYKLYGWFGREGVIDDPIRNTGRSAGLFVGESLMINNVEYDYISRVGTRGRNNINPWHGEVFVDPSTGYFYVLACCFDTYTGSQGMYLGVSKDGMANVKWYARPLFSGDGSLFYYKPSIVLRGRELVIYGTIVIRLATTLGGVFFDATNYPRGASDIPNATTQRHALPFTCHTDFDSLIAIMDDDTLIGGGIRSLPY